MHTKSIYTLFFATHVPNCGLWFVVMYHLSESFGITYYLSHSFITLTWKDLKGIFVNYVVSITVWGCDTQLMVPSFSENFPLISFILSFNVLQEHLEKFCLNAYTFQFLSKIPSRWGAFVSTSDFWNMYGWSSKNVPMENLISVKFVLVPISLSSICWTIFWLLTV